MAHGVVIGYRSPVQLQIRLVVAESHYHLMAVGVLCAWNERVISHGFLVDWCLCSPILPSPVYLLHSPTLSSRFEGTVWKVHSILWSLLQWKWWKIVSCVARKTCIYSHFGDVDCYKAFPKVCSFSQDWMGKKAALLLLEGPSRSGSRPIVRAVGRNFHLSTVLRLWKSKKTHCH